MFNYLDISIIWEHEIADAQWVEIASREPFVGMDGQCNIYNLWYCNRLPNHIGPHVAHKCLGMGFNAKEDFLELWR